MTRIQIRPIRLSKWFPPHDPVATMMAVLCVLREDLLLELYGITNDRIDRLDDNEPAFRRVYFWRNSLRTLAEIKTVLTRLSFQSSFIEAMAKESEEIRTAYKQVSEELNNAHKNFVKDLRDTIGAHLADQPFQSMLDNMDRFNEVFTQAGEIVGTTHYRFAADLLWENVLQEIPESDRLEKIGELLQRTSRLGQVIKTIDDVFACYMRDRHLP